MTVQKNNFTKISKGIDSLLWKLKKNEKLVQFLKISFSEPLEPRQRDQPIDDAFNSLRMVDLSIAIYYIIEQGAKFWANGIVYCQKIEYLYDGCVSSALMAIQIIEQTVIKNSDTTQGKFISSILLRK